ncbi:hypothetical protein ALC62_13306, partial [Cyphomyrmex costatus]
LTSFSSQDGKLVKIPHKFSLHAVPTTKIIIAGQTFKVMSAFFFNHNTLKLTLRKSATNAVKEVEKFWNESGIPLDSVYRSVTKLLKLHEEWKNLKKNRLRKNNPKQQAREKKYIDQLDIIFDIAAPDAANSLTKTQLDFLTSQRSRSRRGFISMDKGDSSELEIREIPDASPADVNAPCILDSPQPQSSGSCQTETLQSSTSSGLKRTVSNFSDEIPQPVKQKINIMTPMVAAALDRTKTSSRSASYILSAVAVSLGFDPNDINLSSSAIHKRRIQLREEIAKQLKEEIRVASNLVVHWDGKLLPDIIGAGSVDRLSIIVSGVGTEQLLCVPKLSKGTGENIATAVVDALYECNLSEHVKAMCFDTTSSNTGPRNGACVLVEEKLEKKLIHLACRHHILELILRNVFETCWPSTSGPNVPVFKRFQQHWGEIDKTKYETGFDDEPTVQILIDQKDEILHFIRSQFEISQPRDDYQEFLELSCIFLGGEPPRGTRFRAPGAMHHARWLSKALYCLKMYIFRRQFALKVREARGLHDICTFIVTIYVNAWFSAPLAVRAPNHDLKLLQSLIAYRNTNADIAAAASSKLASHLWYLSEVLTALAFFDDAVPAEVKSKMVVAARRQGGAAVHMNRIVLNDRDLEALPGKDISDFVTRNSLLLFDQFDLSCDFFDKPPELWRDDPTFKKGWSTFKDLKVVNDVAERGVALIEEYNNLLTKNEEQKQYLLQVVKNHRQLYPNANKRTI